MRIVNACGNRLFVPAHPVHSIVITKYVYFAWLGTVCGEFVKIKIQTASPIQMGMSHRHPTLAALRSMVPMNTSLKFYAAAQV